jgi:UDP-glucose 4-epimerase
MKKAVVTGGAGFIGSHIVDALVARGDEVHVIDNYIGGKREDRFNAKVTYHELDVRDYDAIAPIFAGADYVFHLAALPRVQYSIDEPLESFSVNVGGTIAALRAAAVGGVKRFVLASTAALYGDQDQMPLVETMNPTPKSPYGLHKSMSEQACKLWSDMYGLETVALRFFNVYGPRFDPEGAYALVVGKFLTLRTQGQPLTIAGDGTHTRDYIHVSDVVRANLLAAESASGNGEVFNIATGTETSVNDLARLIGGETVPAEERLEPARCVADISKARTVLGWEPQVALEDGLADLKKEMGIV